jgi:hypothetical protein|tara:strand:+ start:106 stop:300 length:195 start_codon:yes stop_codon:yes gene_type:complete
MGSLKEILIQCQENEKDFKIHAGGMSSGENENRLINLGWIQALRFIEQNFDAEEKTIKEEREIE